MPGALDGVRVIEWAAFHQGPEAAAMLAAMGAEVIKIEELGIGEPARQNKRTLGVPNITPKGLSRYFELYNRGKKGITIDVTKESGRQAVYRLVEKSDVFLTNYRRQAAVRLKLDHDTLKKYNPHLVYSHMSAYGIRGPDSELPAVDFAAASRAGMTTAMLGPDDPPHIVVGLADAMGAACAVLGIMAALYARSQQGIGQEVRTSLLGSCMWIQSTMTGLAFQADMEVPPWNRKYVDPTYNYYRGSDGKWLSIAFGATARIAQQLWPTFCRTIGRPDLLEDARFETRELRLECAEELIQILDEHFATAPRDEWVRRMSEAGLLVGPINRHLDLVNDPQAIANDYVIYYDHPKGERLRTLGFPIEFTETPADVRKPAPALGEHTEEVLSGIAGYTQGEIKRLRDEEAI